MYIIILSSLFTLHIISKTSIKNKLDENISNIRTLLHLYILRSR